MKRLIICSTLLVFCAMPSFAQRNTISAGMLIKNTEVIKKERQKKGLKTIDFKKGYQQEVSFAYSYFEASYYFHDDFGYSFPQLHQLNFNYIGGYRFNHYFYAGIGTGLDFAASYNFRPLAIQGFDFVADSRYHEKGDYITNDRHRMYLSILPVQKVSIPLYVHLRSYFMKTKWSPFLAFSAGVRFSAPKKVDIHEYNEEYSNGQRYRKIGAYIRTEKYGAVTGMFEFMLGVNYQYSKNLGFNFQFGYATRSAHKLQSYYEDATGDYSRISRYEWYHGLTMRLGVTF